MQIAFNPRHYAHVPPLYWPWIWWQLLWLRTWSEAAGRDVLFEILPNGRVVVRHISPEESDLNAWVWREAQIPRAHHLALQDGSGEAHLCPIHYWMGRLMECGERIAFISKRAGFFPAPAIDDSS